jgi:ABC-2 type transport system ATP-binding protein
MREAILQQARAGAAFIISSHLLSLVQDLCTSVLIMDRGRPMRRGNLEELRRQPAGAAREESLEEVFFRVIDATAPAAALAADAADGGGIA